MKYPFLAALFQTIALQRAFAMKYPSHAHGTFNYGEIHSARKKNRRGKIIRRMRSMRKE